MSPEFSSLHDELAFFAQHGLRVNDAEIEVDLRPGELLVFDNLALVHGRRGARRPGELHQRLFGHRRLPPAAQCELRDRMLDAFDTVRAKGTGLLVRVDGDRAPDTCHD